LKLLLTTNNDHATDPPQRIHLGVTSVPSILVVDDEQSICWGLTRLGESMGHEVLAASSAEQALARARQKHPDVIILDVRLPGMDGLSAIERFQDSCGDVPIIVITAYGDLQTAVDAVRRGAFDYIAKPFDVAKVKVSLVRALASRATPSDGVPAPPAHVEGMVGRSPAMQEVYRQIALGDSPLQCSCVAAVCRRKCGWAERAGGRL
jgi:two-component system nitrogen regulation response regulator GlnG